MQHVATIPERGEVRCLDNNRTAVRGPIAAADGRDWSAMTAKRYRATYGSPFQGGRDAWMWWFQAEYWGRAAMTGKKYQRERWHLRGLHDVAALDALAASVHARLSSPLQKATVQVGSIWVDHTPQVRTKFFPTPHARARTVKCELGDLLLVTHCTIGANVSSENTRAVILQAKVADVPGTLDYEGGVSSSSQRERNMLEQCCGPLEVFSGTNSTNKSSLLGRFDLGATPSLAGLESYAKYLTIARAPSRSGQAVNPYEVMWPYRRSSESGRHLPLGDMVLAMLDPGWLGRRPGMPLTGPKVPPDWRQLVDMLAANYYDKIVDRFKNVSRVGIPRLQESRVYSFSTGIAIGNMDSFQFSESASPPGPTNVSLSARGGGGEALASSREDDIDWPLPRIPVIVIAVEQGEGPLLEF